MWKWARTGSLFGASREVTQAISSLDQSFQGNAAHVEQTAAAAASLREQAQPLARSTSVFKLQAG